MKTMRCMDRSLLEIWLAEGLSLAEIGRRLGRHEATVGYWVKKHGLSAAKRDAHIAKGPLSKAELEMLALEGLSIADIAARTCRSKTTVRHWLREYGLTTQWAERRRASAENQPSLTLQCVRHGMAEFSLRASGGYRCRKCSAEAVSRRRRNVKRLLVEEAGGRCSVCGYDRCLAALQFHHVDPAQKRFSLSHRGVARSLERARAEAAKCVLLCANCHAEAEAGLIALKNSAAPAVQ